MLWSPMLAVRSLLASNLLRAMTLSILAKSSVGLYNALSWTVDTMRIEVLVDCLK
jgi:hypothetical protein